MSKNLLNTSSERKRESGFTLIELSIVLVIIGLIVGGILTGQDLIKAAEQRATLAQVEKYNTAVNTFRNKFGGIPGDLLYSTANSFNLGPGGTATLTAPCGDGNGMLQAGGSGGWADTPYGEILMFWSELSTATLIDGSLGQTDVSATTCQSAAGTTATDLPLAKLGRGNYFIVGADDTLGYNWFGLAGIPSTFTGGAGGTAKYGAATNNLNPLESYSMDKKVDDGLPNTGVVQARDATKLNTIAQVDGLMEALTATNEGTNATTSTAGKCVVDAAPLTLSSTYNVTNTSGNASSSTPACSLVFRFN